VQVCDQNSRVRAILSLPEGSVTSLWFGGEKFDILFVTCGGKLYKCKLNVTGAQSSIKAVISISQGRG
jgi:sugar lactone lactonase YvrE